MPAPLNAETAKKIEERKKQYIEELKAQANKELVDFEERPLEKWLKSCEMLRNQMDLAKQDGDSKRHYIFGMRLCNLVSDQLPKHPEYKQVRHRDMKKRVAKMMDDTIDEVVASRGILLAKEETRFLDQLEERKRLEAQAIKINTTAVGDSMDAHRGHIGAGDAMVMEGMKSLPVPNRQQPQSLPVGTPIFTPAPPSQVQAHTRNLPAHGASKEEFSIGVPIHDDGSDVQFLLPKDNRMSMASFRQQERNWVPPNRSQSVSALPPRHAPSPMMPPSSSESQQRHRYSPAPQQTRTRPSVRFEEESDADLARALAESAAMAKQEDSKMTRLRERLEMYTEYELEEVDNTGHCQFDAVAHQIRGRFATQYSGGADYALRYTWREVRRDLANWLRVCGDFVLENGERIKDFLDEEDGKTWEAFCDNIEHKDDHKSPTWGNHLTLIAAANCYQRPIRVWSTVPGNDWWLQINPKHYDPKNPVRPFELAHLYERHYLSVTERKSSQSKTKR